MAHRLALSTSQAANQVEKMEKYRHLSNLLKLAQLALTLPLQTADVERGFSAQTVIKTAHRNRMEENTLVNLRTISVEGPAVESFDFNRAVFSWKRKKERRIFKK